MLYHIQHDTIMPIQKYEVSLSAEDRKQLTKIVKSGNMPARTILRANILLAVDRNGKQPMTVQEAAIAFNTSASRGQGYRRRRGSYHSSRLRRSSQGICQVDASSSCRQVGQTGVYRIYISYAEKIEYRPHLKKCWCILAITWLSSQRWRTSSRCTAVHMMPNTLSYVWTRNLSNFWQKQEMALLPTVQVYDTRTTNM